MTTTPPRRRPRAIALVLGGLSGWGAGGAWAQDLERQQPVRIGEAALYPSLRVDYLVDDNIGLRADDEVDGSAVLVSPRLDFLADRRQLELRAFYAGQYSRGSEDPLDWADHVVGASLDAEFGARRRAGLSLTVRRGHDELGLDLTRGLADAVDEPVRFNDTDLEASFTYGAVAARGNLVAGLRLGDVSYVNLPGVTDGRDYASIEPFGQFSYRVSGDTRAVVELALGSYDFDEDADGRDPEDRDELTVGAGLRFAATGKLRGGFLLGVSNASYSDDDVEDESAFTARADIDWLVREYATIGLDLSRQFDNVSPTTSVGGENQAIRTIVRLGWAHEWSTRFGTDAFVQLSDVARACPELATSVAGGGLEANLSVRRWLTFGAGVSLLTRTASGCDGRSDADEAALEFDRTRFGVHVRATL